jgi:tetratricopeptide (TPR) repeat protein
MKISILLYLIILFNTVTFGQTPPCGERDFRCQLAAAMKAMEADPKNPENYYNVGVVLQKSGGHKESIEIYSMYIAIPGVKPDLLADGYNNRGIAYRTTKRPALAHADFTKAIELAPRVSRFYVNRANANADLGKVDEAFADYDKAGELDPKNALAYIGRAALLAKEGKIDDAINEYPKAISADPANPESYYNRGVLLSGKKEFAKAISDYDKYISLIRDNPEYLADGHMNRGIAKAMTGNLKEAVDDFTRVIELKPDSAKAYRARALVYRQMKKNELAEADERKAGGL